MVNQQMVNRNMGGVMGPMMNMPSMPNQQMVNPMMGPQGMNYNQGGMPNPGILFNLLRPSPTSISLATSHLLVDCCSVAN